MNLLVLLNKHCVKGIVMTQNELKKLLHYDQSTGIFTWLQSRGRVKAGSIAGSKQKHGHLAVKIDGKNYHLHRLAWLYAYGKFPNNMIDHINGIAYDNRIDNLRDVTNAVNQHNQKNAHVNSKSRLIGASWNKQNKAWKAQITHHGKVIYLGLYETAQFAHEAYLKAKRQLHIGCTI